MQHPRPILASMSRPLRLEFDDALYRVTSRGDRREPIFIDDADRLMWLDVFGQVCGRFNSLRWVKSCRCPFKAREPPSSQVRS